MYTVSIVTTTRNRRALLKKTIDSVLAQSYPAIEHIIIDAKSDDGTPDFIASCEAAYKKKGYVLQWISEKDSGQGEGMNKGLRMVTGDLIVLLNDDDWLAGDSIATYAKVFEEHPDVDFVYGPEEVHYEDGVVKRFQYRTYSFQDAIKRGYSIPQSECMFKSELINKHGVFDESLRHVAEFELFLRFFKHGAKALYIPEPSLQIVYEHGGRKTNVGFRRSHEETKEVIFRHGGTYFSPYYVTYLKNTYFGGFFNWLQTKFPKIYNAIKGGFNKMRG
jgi:glycosyltransferase involved in cell wall biosynthesis